MLIIHKNVLSESSNFWKSRGHYCFFKANTSIYFFLFEVSKKFSFFILFGNLSLICICNSVSRISEKSGNTDLQETDTVRDQRYIDLHLLQKPDKKASKKAHEFF